MTTVYTLPSRKSCRDMMKKLEEHGTPFVERRLQKHSFSAKELMEIVNHCESIYDLLSEKSSAYKKVKEMLEKEGLTFEDLTFSTLAEIIREFPAILSTPITYNGKTVVVGFDAEAYEPFINKNNRKTKINTMLKELREKEDKLISEKKLVCQGHWW